MHENDLRNKYYQEGILFPLPALNKTEIEEAQAQYINLCTPGNIILQGNKRLFGHLLYPWVTKLVSHPAILEKVSALIGENILVWVSEFNAKAPKSSNFFSWHQDLYYWGHQYKGDLATIPMVTVWLSLFDTHQLNGCMRVILGSHTQLVKHTENFKEHNLLTRSQEVEVDVNENNATPIILSAGEFSIHHPLIYHASGPNLSNDGRVGLVIRYLSPKIAPPVRPAYAWLVSGEDHHAQWDHLAPINFSIDHGSELCYKSMLAVQACTGAHFK